MYLNSVMPMPPFSYLCWKASTLDPTRVKIMLSNCKHEDGVIMYNHELKSKTIDSISKGKENYGFISLIILLRYSVTLLQSLIFPFMWHSIKARVKIVNHYEVPRMLPIKDITTLNEAQKLILVLKTNPIKWSTKNQTLYKILTALNEVQKANTVIKTKHINEPNSECTPISQFDMLQILRSHRHMSHSSRLSSTYQSFPPHHLSSYSHIRTFQCTHDLCRQFCTWTTTISQYSLLPYWSKFDCSTQINALHSQKTCFVYNANETNH